MNAFVEHNETCIQDFLNDNLSNVCKYYRGISCEQNNLFVWQCIPNRENKAFLPVVPKIFHGKWKFTKAALPLFVSIFCMFLMSVIWLYISIAVTILNVAMFEHHENCMHRKWNLRYMIWSLFYEIHLPPPASSNNWNWGI